MDSVAQEFSKLKVIPVVTIENPDDAAPLARALSAGGIPAAEITFRTAGAAEAIRSAVKACPQMLVGAGTVLTPDQVDAAHDAGAKFIVSPGLDPETVRYCQKLGLPVFPGCVTATEVQQGLRLGLEVLKFFPAEASGGLRTLKALSAPFPQVRWMPTGGISLSNLADYLAFGRIVACGGSFLTEKEDIRSKNWEKITAICRRTVELVGNPGVRV